MSTKKSANPCIFSLHPKIKWGTVPTMKPTFNDIERRFLYELGVPRGMVYRWENGQPIGKRYARQVAKVKGLTLEQVLYPPDDKEDEEITG